MADQLRGEKKSGPNVPGSQCRPEPGPGGHGRGLGTWTGTWDIDGDLGHRRGLGWLAGWQADKLGCPARAFLAGPFFSGKNGPGLSRPGPITHSLPRSLAPSLAPSLPGRDLPLSPLAQDLPLRPLARDLPPRPCCCHHCLSSLSSLSLLSVLTVFCGVLLWLLDVF